jgi:MarR family transcriptional regulator for hemolysin
MDAHPRARFGLQFGLLARRWRRTLDARLAEAGLSDATWAPLVHLHESGDGISQKALAALVGLDASSLVRLIDILVARGLVERRTDATDRRARLIHLTDAGRRAVAEILRLLVGREAEILADVSDAELVQVMDVFARIGRRLPQLGEDRP